MAANTTPRKQHAQPPLDMVSMRLSLQDRVRLAALAQSASERLGLTISASAVVRALLRSPVNEVAVHDALVKEVAGGRVWGSTPHDRSIATRHPQVQDAG